MIVRKFAIADATLERSPGQDGDIFAGNVIDQRHGRPITIGYGRYRPGQIIDVILAVDDGMVVLEGKLSVSTSTGTLGVGPGKIVYIPKGEAVTCARTSRARNSLCHLSTLAKAARLSPAASEVPLLAAQRLPVKISRPSIQVRSTRP